MPLLHIIDGGTVGEAGKEFYRVTHIKKDREFYHKPCPEGLVCHWCVHPIHPRVPVGLPMAYKERKERFRVDRQFCSWNCCLAFSHNLNDTHKYERSMWIRLLAKRMHGHKMSEPMRIAPRREVLSIFGGCVEDIEEFRRGCQSAIVLEEPPMCTVVPEEHNILTRLKHPKYVPPPQPRGSSSSSSSSAPCLPPPPPPPAAAGEKGGKNKKKQNYTLKNNTPKPGQKRRQNQSSQFKNNGGVGVGLGGGDSTISGVGGKKKKRKSAGRMLENLGITIN